MAADVEARLRHIEDERALEALMVAYHRACDAAEGKGAKVAALFTEDCVWQPVGPHATPGWEAVGRAALVPKFDRNHERMPFAQHHLTGGQVHVDGDAAAGWWSYFQACTHRGTTALWIAGEYHVDFRRLTEGWRIAHLRVQNHFTTPFDQGWVAVPHVATP